LLRKFEVERREVPLSEHMYREEATAELEFPELYVGNKAENKIADLVQTLRDPCKSILRYFYFRGFSMEEIADVMNYKNAQTVKAQKLRCIKEMQSLVHRQMRTAL
jgi:RNA polymerase sigma-70 factor (ECF subfamily)